MLKPATPAALSVLRRADVLADRVVLPPARLERELYSEVKRVLENLGGEWSTSAQAFVFSYDFMPTLRAVMDGAPFPLRNPTAFFPTPDDLAEWVVGRSIGLTNLPRGARVLEPSCGRGALIKAAVAVRPDLRVEACEIDPHHRRHLEASGINLVGDDFLLMSEIGTPYDAVVMNPPFSLEDDKLAWLTHVEKAMRLLAPGGVLVAILPEAAKWRDTKAIVEWRKRVTAMGGEFVVNRKDSFRSSGTLAGTVTLYLGGFLSEEKRKAMEEEAKRGERIARVSAIVPTTAHADEIAAANRNFRDFHRLGAVLPNATKLSDLFSEVRIMKGDDFLDTYICGHGSAAETSFRGKLRPEIKAAIDASLVVHDGYVYLATTEDSDGWTRVFWNNNAILGSRFLGIVESRSLVEFERAATAAAA